MAFTAVASFIMQYINLIFWNHPKLLLFSFLLFCVFLYLVQFWSRLEEDRSVCWIKDSYPGISKFFKFNTTTTTRLYPTTCGQLHKFSIGIKNKVYVTCIEHLIMISCHNKWSLPVKESTNIKATVIQYLNIMLQNSLNFNDCAHLYLLSTLLLVVFSWTISSYSGCYDQYQLLSSSVLVCNAFFTRNRSKVGRTCRFIIVNIGWFSNFSLLLDPSNIFRFYFHL